MGGRCAPRVFPTCSFDPPHRKAHTGLVPMRVSICPCSLRTNTFYYPQVTSDKEGPNSEFQKHIKDAEVLITTPFHPGYATGEILKTAKNLKLAVTAGVGSDHIDLNAANEHKITVAEVSGSNVVSVAEHVIMTILLLVRNYNVGHAQAVGGEWQVSQIARDAFDLENKVIGTIGAGRIGYRVLERLVPFNPKQLLYYDYTELPADAAKKVGVERVTDLNDFLSRCDVVTVNCPLHEGTINLINKDNIKHMKKESWLVNTARGAICNAEAVADAVNSGAIMAYGGDVWQVSRLRNLVFTVRIPDSSFGRAHFPVYRLNPLPRTTLGDP